jgi:hypothetical protein
MLLSVPEMRGMSKNLKKKKKGCSSSGRCLPNTYKVLGSSPSIVKEKQIVMLHKNLTFPDTILPVIILVIVLKYCMPWKK